MSGSKIGLGDVCLLFVSSPSCQEVLHHQSPGLPVAQEHVAVDLGNMCVCLDWVYTSDIDEYFAHARVESCFGTSFALWCHFVNVGSSGVVRVKHANDH